MTQTLKDKKILVIVESPNKVRHIQDYLKKAGYNVKVMASVGHIMELGNGGNYYNSGVDPDKDFRMNLQVADDKQLIVNKLKAQADWADLIYLMSDPDREGYVIAWSLAKFLQLPVDKYRRAITHEITPKAVVAAIENPVTMDENLIDAGLARWALDKIVGYRLSPIAKTYVGAKSVGRCQSAGLKLICDREEEIQKFIPEVYFDLYLNFTKNKTKFKAKYAGTETIPLEHLKNKAAVDAVKAECVGEYVVGSIDQKEKQEAPKPPFCTATFQQEASSKLGLKVKDAMGCAQKLFESGHITYMRTDDTAFAPEFISTLKAYIDQIFGKSAWTAPRKGKKQEGAQEGHECLRITDPTLTPEIFVRNNGEGLLAKVYKIIWQRTIAAALPNAIISETTYNIYNKKNKFTLISNELLSPGYRSVYAYADEDAGDETAPVKETFATGEKLLNTSLEATEKATKPKPRYTEATFIKELQKREIGRPSTYASIIETVLSATRNYARLENKVIVPTDIGMQLTKFLERSFPSIISLDFTKEMEKQLDNIASNKVKKLTFLKAFHSSLEEAIKINPETSKTAETKFCPNCGAPMVVRRSRYGKLFYGCSTYPKCTGIVNIN